MPQGKSRTTLLHQEQLDEQKIESNSSDSYSRRKDCRCGTRFLTFNRHNYS